MAQSLPDRDRFTTPTPPAEGENPHYFTRRLAQELQLAEDAPSEAERRVHLDACELLCRMLGIPSDSPPRRADG